MTKDEVEEFLERQCHEVRAQMAEIPDEKILTAAVAIMDNHANEFAAAGRLTAATICLSAIGTMMAVIKPGEVPS